MIEASRAARHVAGQLADLLTAALGRRLVVRAARFVLHRARLDVPNDLHRNGERLVQRLVLESAPVGTIVVFDVGANVGQWTEALLTAAGRVGLQDLQIHAFEPSAYTCDRLAKRLGGTSVVLNRLGLSEHAGEAILHIRHPGAGVNSLHASTSGHAEVKTEQIPLSTVDHYCTDRGIDRVHMLKVDTEGHDLSVIRGARSMLTEHRIAVVQFEYNHRWIFARAYLRDAFQEFEPLGYRLGKVTPRGVEFYDGWDPELETFVEGNYLACLPNLVPALRPITWWKAE